MTSRAKRLTLTIGAIALVAVICGAVMVPDTIAAPKKPKPPKKPPPGTGAFVIEVNEEGWVGGYIGDFVATGAIEDSGMASEGFYGDVVYLRGARGEMELEINGDTFEIVYGSRRYADLLGLTGSHYTPGGVPTSWIYRRFEGTVPE